MASNTRVRINMRDNSTWEILVKPDALKNVRHLPSGQVFTLQRQVSDIQTQDVLIRPYYRRVIRSELHIFAVEVVPSW
jgi:hypothetical protein